jgi:hypothetical protein
VAELGRIEGGFVFSILAAVIDAYRGQHPEFVFHRRGLRLMSMNNNGWQRTR